MEKYRRAKKYYSENKFEQAKTHFEMALNSEVLNESEKLDCLEQIVKIHKSIQNKKTYNSAERELANYYIDKKEFSLASNILIGISKSSYDYEIAFLLISTLVSAGELEQAEKEAVALLSYLLKRKNINKLKKVYDYIENNLSTSVKFKTFYYLGLICIGDMQNFNNLELNNKNDEVIYELLLKMPFVHWRHSEFYNQMIIEKGLDLSDKELNKKGIKSLLESVIMGQLPSSKTLNITLTYFLFKKRKTISRLICNFAEESSISLDESLINKIDSLPEDKSNKIEFDFGEDLLDSPEEQSEIDELVKNILFLNTINESASAEVYIRKLKKLDPDNNYFLEKESEANFSAEDSAEGLINKISIVNNEDNDLIAKAKVAIESLDEKCFMKQYADLVVCFNSMKLYGASFIVFEKVDRIANEQFLKDDLSYNYLKIETLMLCEEYYKAYDLVTNFNGVTPIHGEKRIEFLYLQGEIARHVGRYSEARKSYSLVAEINPRYRLVQQRLENLG